MFELNQMFLRKMGWRLANQFIKGIDFIKVPQDWEPLLWIQPTGIQKTFVLVEVKQTDLIEYKFLIVNGIGNSISLKKFKSIDVESNLHLMKLISEWECCSEDYQRHFRLTKLLK